MRWRLPIGRLACQAVIAAGLFVGFRYQPFERNLLRSGAASAATVATEPVRVSGRITLGTQPGAHLPVRVSMSQGAARVITTTDTKGRFSVGLAQPGEYFFEVATLETLSSTHRYATVVAGDNALTIELPDTRIAVTLRPQSGAPATAFKRRSTQLVIRGPIAPTAAFSLGFIRIQSDYKANYVGVGFGNYSIAAYNRAGWVSRDLGRVILTEDSPRAAVTLDMVQRELQLTVQDFSGNRIHGAAAKATSYQLRKDRQGNIDAGTVPAGEPISIEAPGFMPTCVFARREAGHQVVRMPALGTHQVRITLVGGPKNPVGAIEGLPGAQCPVPVQAFRLVPLEGDSRDQVFDVSGLPQGEFVYKVQELAPSMTLKVPGLGIRYIVPEYCRFCGSK